MVGRMAATGGMAAVGRRRWHRRVGSATRVREAVAACMLKSDSAFLELSAAFHHGRRVSLLAANPHSVHRPVPTAAAQEESPGAGRCPVAPKSRRRQGSCDRRAQRAEQSAARAKGSCSEIRHRLWVHVDPGTLAGLVAGRWGGVAGLMRLAGGLCVQQEQALQGQARWQEEGVRPPPLPAAAL